MEVIVLVMSDKADYELNYVYIPEGLDEYRSVNVTLKVLRNRVKLIINSEDDISPEDLKNLVKGLQKEISTKIGIDIRHECTKYLFIRGTEFYIDYNTEMSVYKLEYKV